MQHINIQLIKEEEDIMKHLCILGVIVSLLVLGCKSEDDSSNSIFVNVSKCNEGLSTVSHYDGLACGELKNTSGASNVYISNVSLNCAFSKSYAKITESSDSIEIVIRYGEQSDTEFSAKCNCYFDFVIPIESKTENISKIDIKFINMANNVEEELVISPQDAPNRCKYTVYGYKFGIDHNTSGIENLHRYCSSDEECGQELLCKAISDNENTRVCMKRCRENSDCPYNNILVCKDGVCAINNKW